MSLNAVGYSVYALYSTGLRKPSDTPAFWSASATTPASSGEARLVPPSLNCA